MFQSFIYKYKPRTYQLIDTEFSCEFQNIITWTDLYFCIIKEYEKRGYSNLGEVVALMIIYQTKNHTPSAYKNIIINLDMDLPDFISNWSEIAKERDKYLQKYFLLQ